MKDKLTSMRDFVQEQHEEHSLDNEFSSFEFMNNCKRYADFLSQNLSERYEVNGVMAHPLNRFVACDLNGNILEEPKKVQEPTPFSWKEFQNLKKLKTGYCLKNVQYIT